MFIFLSNALNLTHLIEFILGIILFEHLDDEIHFVVIGVVLKVHLEEGSIFVQEVPNLFVGSNIKEREPFCQVLEELSIE